MEDATETKRGPGRPPINRPEQHPVDPRERLKARTAEILGHIGELDGATDEFYIDPAIIPDGWSYEWKTYMVLGATDPSKQVELARQGWEPVPTSRHPELMPAGTNETVISRKGNRLMERPLEVTELRRKQEYQRARAQVKMKEEQLTQAPAGQFERDNKGNPLAKVRKTYEPMAIPD